MAAPPTVTVAAAQPQQQQSLSPRGFLLKWPINTMDRNSSGCFRFRLEETFQVLRVSVCHWWTYKQRVEETVCRREASCL